MSANRIFLVCSHHRSPEDALLIAQRAPNTALYETVDMKRAAKWFERHAPCGKPDDFQIAYGFPQNHDVTEIPLPKPAAAAVRLALVNGSKHE